MRAWWGVVFLGVALPCSGVALGPAAKVFLIAGVAMSARDGSPIPYCRLTATAVVEAPEGRGFGRGGFGNGNVDFGLQVQFDGGSGQGGGSDGGRGGQGRRRGAPEPEIATTADAQGRFTLTVPHGGAWRLSGTARGYKAQLFDQHDNYYAQVVLSDAVPVYTLNFRMARNAVIDGAVYDEAGEPVRQARVQAELIPMKVPGQLPVRPRPQGQATTDDRGHYELANLAPGAYRLKVTAQPWYAAGASRQGNVVRVAGATATNNNDLGASLDPSLDLVYATTWFPGSDSEETAAAIELVGGDERQADFHLNAVSSIHLRVPRPEVAAATGPTSGPGGGRGGQQQRTATITKVSADGAIGQAITVGANGNSGDWDFGGLTPGIYEVRLPGADGRPDGGEVRQVEVQAGSRVVTMESAKALTKVTVKVEGMPDGDFPFVEFVDLQTGRRITAQEGRGGRGGGRGRRGDDVGGDDPAPALQDRTLTASLPTGRYAVSVTSNNVYLTGIAATDARVLGRIVEIAGGSPALTLTVGSGEAELSGTVKDVGRAVEGAMVLLVPIALGQPGDTSSVARAESNSDGSFRFRGVEPGRYIAVAIDHGWSVAWESPQALAAFLGKGVPVELQPGAKAKEELGSVVP